MKYEIKPKKYLGQNFLANKFVLRNIIKIAQVSHGDTVVEIGPGTGALTEYLLQAGADVIAIEKDKLLFSLLEEKFSHYLKNGQLILIANDVLEFDVDNELPGIMKNDTPKYKLVANIPYYITGEILRMFLSANLQPETATLMLQKEVAQRIIASNNKESVLSISVKAYGKPKYALKVPASCFKPSPKVDSAVLRISGISKNFFKENEITEKCFFKLVKTCFSQKRKKLSNNLRKLLGEHIDKKLLIQMKQMGIHENMRAEDLNFEQWGKLANIICVQKS